MAGKCRWCGKGCVAKYCYRHRALGTILDDLMQQISIVNKMMDGKVPVSLYAIRDNLIATKQTVLDELERV